MTVERNIGILNITFVPETFTFTYHVDRRRADHAGLHVVPPFTGAPALHGIEEISATFTNMGHVLRRASSSALAKQVATDLRAAIEAFKPDFEKEANA